MKTQTDNKHTGDLRTIVLAKMAPKGVKEHESETEYRDGILRAKLVFFSIPEACIWLNEGDSTDLEKAYAFAFANGFTVYDYPICETDPLGKAKNAISLATGKEGK